MTPEGWALLWIGGINVVWACIFVGVLVFALRTDTEAEVVRTGRGGPEPEPQPPHLPRPRPRSRRLRGAERAAARRRRTTGATYYPRDIR